MSPSDALRSKAPAVPPSRASSGFTLLEVTFAFAMVTFALVAVIGLIPAGLLAMRNSIEEGIAARVFQTVTSQLRHEADLPERYYFDSEGCPSPAAVEGGFMAEVVPISPATDAVDEKGTPVRIDIFYRPNPTADSTAPPLATSRLILLQYQQ